MDATATSIAELGAVLILAVGAGWGARRLGLPAVVGYLAVGLAIGPFTPGFVAGREQIQLLADIGVVLLLFEVGIELDIRRLREERRAILWLAPLQALGTTVLAGAVFLAAGLEPIGASIAGLCVANSSSVVVVNITRSVRRTTDTATEHDMLGWTLVQDITCTVGALVLLTIAGAASRPLPEAILGIAAFLVAAGALALVLPKVLRGLREHHDLFLIMSVASGLAIAGLGSAELGLPLGLAAFVAGMAITESSEAMEARQRLLPFRDLLAVLFFVTIGMLIDPSAIVRAPTWLALILVLVVLSKGSLIYGFVRLAPLASRPAQMSVGLSQVGEFSFVIASAALALGAIDNDLYVAMLAAVALTIAMSTVGTRLVGRPRAG